MQEAAFQPALDLRDGGERVVRVGQVELDMVFRPGLPRTLLGKGVPRARDDAPAGAGEALDGGVTNPPARSGEEQGATRLIALRSGHNGSDPNSRIEPRLDLRR